MPEYLMFKNEEVIKNLYDNILYRDIIVRFNIKDSKTLRELANILLSNTANLWESFHTPEEGFSVLKSMTKGS